jgi:hypothetical protein
VYLGFRRKEGPREKSKKHVPMREEEYQEPMMSLKVNPASVQILI